MSERKISLMLTFIFILLIISASFSIYKYSKSPEFTTIEGLGVNSQKIVLKLDKITVKDDVIKFTGWAIIRGIENKINEKKIILMNISTGNICELVSTKNVIRTDVTSHFNSRVDYDNSGFEAEVLKGKLKKGKYRIGILISDNSGGRYKMGRDTVTVQ